MAENPTAYSCDHHIFCVSSVALCLRILSCVQSVYEIVLHHPHYPQVKLRSCQAIGFQPWAREMEACRRHEHAEPWEAPSFHCHLRRLRQDATNTAMWSGKKLSVTELLISSTTKPVCADSDWATIWEHIETRAIMTTLKSVRGASTGKAVLGIIDAHLESVGEQQVWQYCTASPVLLALCPGGTGAHAFRFRCWC